MAAEIRQRFPGSQVELVPSSGGRFEVSAEGKPVFQKSVLDVYSFNNHALQRFHETLKDAVDPNGILSAGRYAIWPKHLREEKR